MSDTIIVMLEQLAAVQDELHRIRQETGIEELEERISAMKKAIGEAVLEHGAPVKGSVLQAVINKGRVTWNSKLLEGMAKIIPQLETAREEGKPTVTIRGVK